GLLAIALGTILAIELVVTLIDFVEEDMTRRLPATERVLHTLLALNYGAILVLLAPIIWAWAGEPTGLALANNGLWSLFMVFAGIGVLPFGIRDLFAAQRLERMHAAQPGPLLKKAGRQEHVLITGGTGFIGSKLATELALVGHRVTVLTRAYDNARELDAPVRIITNLDQIADTEKIDHIVNLAGAPIVGGLWTKRQKERLLESRLQTTKALLNLIERLETRPHCFISGSAIGIYGKATTDPVDEFTPIIGDDSFAQELCVRWESLALQAQTLGVRTITLRTGLVLDTAGGTLGQMLFPFEFGLGGPFGNGAHWMSWITRDDLVRLIHHCMLTETIDGPVNGVAPTPVTNLGFTKALGEALNRPTLFAIPKALIMLGLGQLGEEIFFGSQFVLARKALESGFIFRATRIDRAFEQLFAQLEGTARPAPPVTKQQAYPLAGRKLDRYLGT
ncbi:MAG: TIGR01777 family oxidoreductase, partial [Pseudomonadota bacterium]